MTAGAPLYLVSACATGEEFVAAFRRYADRNGVLFIPTAEPLSSGKRGRFAVTLKDGGVMIEGDAEVVSAAKTPSVLYGRIGMTVKFTEPDELSKVVLGELEKARLALKPAAPSVPPRPATLPGDKRPTPPPPGGRIDAVNALAECVILGELPDAVPTTASSGGSGRVTVPPIMQLRSKKLTQPPVPKLDDSTRTKAPTAPPAIPGLPGTKATTLGMMPLKADAPAAASFPPMPPSTLHGVSHEPRPPAAPLVAPPPPIIESPTAVDAKAPQPKSETMQMPSLTQGPKIDLDETLRGTMPMPPVVGDAPVRTPAVEIAEPTDVSPVPPGAPTDVHPVPRLTDLGLAVAKPTVEEPTPSGDWTMTPGENGPTITKVPRPAPKGPPTGDWSIALDPSRPDGWSEPSKIEKRPPGELPPGPPVSTVTSAEPLDSNANLPDQQVVPEGGPSIEIDPTLAAPPIEVPDEPSAPAAAPLPKGSFVAPLLTPTRTPAVEISPEQHLAMLGIAPAPRALTDAGTGFFRDSGDIPRYPTEPTAVVRRRKRTIVIVASAAAAVVVGLVLLFSLGGDDEKSAATPPAVPGVAAGSSTGSAAPVPVPTPAPNPPPTPTPEVAPPAVGSNAGSAEEPPPSPADVAVTSDACEVKVTSRPAGADIVVGGEVVGRTPKALSLTCGVATKLSLRRARYVNANVTVTPSPEKPKPVTVTLARVTMTVKVSSAPAGATITLGRKSLGVTPTTVKLPAFETSTIKITKPGFTPQTQTLTPKQNNLSVHAVLRRAGRR